ncbi:hypothetical protein EXIGLDRAFT_699471 [Exidia glandulosa HHB12029]|uniref:Uncharacterized protein n=1 Tax=Exidia glandulosa HHB12029 TaxID=1314781 RepID=A0A165DVD7_EXIGL|nr:hypothetical protein EXIGLDRAFT_699471 [Exidia glandulosa HHB12029]
MSAHASPTPAPARPASRGPGPSSTDSPSTEGGSGSTIKRASPHASGAPGPSQPPPPLSRRGRATRRLNDPQAEMYYEAEDGVESTNPEDGVPVTTSLRRRVMALIDCDLPWTRIIQDPVNDSGEIYYHFHGPVTMQIHLACQGLETVLELLYGDDRLTKRLPWNWLNGVSTDITRLYMKYADLMVVFTWAQAWMHFALSYIRYLLGEIKDTDIPEMPSVRVAGLVADGARHAEARLQHMVPESRAHALRPLSGRSSPASQFGGPASRGRSRERSSSRSHSRAHSTSRSSQRSSSSRASLVQARLDDLNLSIREQEQRQDERDARLYEVLNAISQKLAPNSTPSTRVASPASATKGRSSRAASVSGTSPASSRKGRTSREASVARQPSVVEMTASEPEQEPAPVAPAPRRPVSRRRDGYTSPPAPTPARKGIFAASSTPWQKPFEDAIGPDTRLVDETELPAKTEDKLRDRMDRVNTIADALRSEPPRLSRFAEGVTGRDLYIQPASTGALLHAHTDLDPRRDDLRQLLQPPDSHPPALLEVKGLPESLLITLRTLVIQMTIARTNAEDAAMQEVGEGNLAPRASLLLLRVALTL